VDFLYEPYLDNGLLAVAFAVGIVRLRQGFRPARYFLAGLALVFTGYLHATRCTWSTSSCWDRSFTSTRLAWPNCCAFRLPWPTASGRSRTRPGSGPQKVIEGLQEREFLKEKLNQELERLNGELEEKVLLRTRKIERQAAEIARINQLLQAHNKKLEGQVVHISTAHLDAEKRLVRRIPAHLPRRGGLPAFPRRTQVGRWLHLS
jgi:hypothetical protein